MVNSPLFLPPGLLLVPHNSRYYLPTSGDSAASMATSVEKQTVLATFLFSTLVQREVLSNLCCGRTKTT